MPVCFEGHEQAAWTLSTVQREDGQFYRYETRCDCGEWLAAEFRRRDDSDEE